MACQTNWRVYISRTEIDGIDCCTLIAIHMGMDTPLQPLAFPVFILHSRTPASRNQVLIVHSIFNVSRFPLFPLGERHGSAAERLLAGSRVSLMKEQQQQHVMANVMSSMLSSMAVPPPAVPLVQQQVVAPPAVPASAHTAIPGRAFGKWMNDTNCCASNNREVFDGVQWGTIKAMGYS